MHSKTAPCCAAFCLWDNWGLLSHSGYLGTHFLKMLDSSAKKKSEGRLQKFTTRYHLLLSTFTIVFLFVCLFPIF